MSSLPLATEAKAFDELAFIVSKITQTYIQQKFKLGSLRANIFGLNT
jgi:hypothetical protein